MGGVKDIRLKVIPHDIANPFVERYHYSGTYMAKSNLHLGAFLDGSLHGVISFGSPIDKNKVIDLVHYKGKPVKWNNMIEIHRMAFDDYLPKNSESRCLSVSFKMIEKNAPHIQWILSYADATQCGDGAIYRAVGFHLTQIKENTSMLKMPDGSVVCDKSLNNANNAITGKTAGWWKKNGAEPLKGYQLRYIYLLDPGCTLNCPDLPYSKIDEVGANMYKGEKLARQEHT